MNATGKAIVLGLIFAFLHACNSGEPPSSKHSDLQLEKAKYLIVKYRVKDEDKRMEIRDPQTVSELLSLIKVERIETDRYYTWSPFGKVAFMKDDDAEIMTLGFYRPTILHRYLWGQIYLKDDSFHERLSSIVSNRDGRKTVIWAPND